MARHHITTASLLRDISERRALEATDRWHQVRRDYMRPGRWPSDPELARIDDDADHGGSRPASV